MFKRYIYLCFLQPLLLLGCYAEPPTPLRVASHEWPGYEPLHLARELGFLDENLVHLYEVPSATASIRAFRDGYLDAAALTFDEALMLLHDHVPVKVLFVMDLSNGADALLAQPEFSDIHDLKGRRVGVESIALGAYVLARALEKANMNADDVVPVFFPFHKHQNAFEQREVEGLVTFEPVKGVLERAGARLLMDSRQLPNEIFDVLVVHEKVLADRAPAVHMMIDAWFKSLNFIKENPEQAASLIAKRIDTTPHDVLVSLEGIILPSIEENLVLLSGQEPQLVSVGRNLVEVMIKHRLMSNPVDVERIIDPRVEFYLKSQ